MPAYVISLEATAMIKKLKITSEVYMLVKMDILPEEG